MAITLKGADKLMNKLSQISNMDTSDIVSQSSKKVKEALVNEASQFSGTAYKCINQGDTRVYGLSSFIDVGLIYEDASFEDYKSLYFHNYGYVNMGLGGIFKGKYMNMHINWFELAVKSVEKDILRDIKGKLQKEIRAINNV